MESDLGLDRLKMRIRTFALAAAAVALPCSGVAHTKKPLDHSVYDSWKSIRGTGLSRDGKWLAYVVAPQEGDGNGILRSLVDGHTIDVPRISGFRFTIDSQFAVGMVPAPFIETRDAKRKKAKPEDMPKASLAIVNLTSGATTLIPKVASFTLPEEDSDWIAYKMEPEKPAAPAKSEAAKPEAAKPEADKKEKKTGQTWVVRNFATGKEEPLPDVTSLVMSKRSPIIAYAVASKAGTTDGVFALDLKSDAKTTLVLSKLEAPQIAISPEGAYCSYMLKAEDSKDKAPAESELYVYSFKEHKATRIGLDSIPKGCSINPKSDIRFSDRSTRLLYSTYPTPPAPAKEVPDDEKVSVDIWNWKDPHLQTEQLLGAERERNRGYLAEYDIASKKSHQIADKELNEVVLSDKDDGRFALGETSEPYDIESTWDPGYQDAYTIDLTNGNRTLIGKHFKGRAVLSPKGTTVAVYNGAAGQWDAYNCETGDHAVLSAGIPNSVSDELFDQPDAPEAYGIAGWLDEHTAVLEDRYDLWKCDATGAHPPVALTSGRGLHIRYRPVNLDPDDFYLHESGQVLESLNEDSKDAGVYRLDHGVTTRLIGGPKTYGGFVKAKHTDRLVFTQQDFVEYPDLWVTDLGFGSPVKVSEANPQQKNYNWGKAELVEWTSLDGVKLQGILIKPEDFDYGKKYPMITYFYERLSDSLYSYHQPAPSASTINFPLFASNGYCIFVPDIPYRTGYPGPSAMSAILPGVQSIVSRGYIDPKRLGVEGQSWGGYQVAYLVTQTNMFAAAEAGAPVGDMFSAYGGIRYGSGVVREMQYEHGQSRIGGTPWDSTLKYIENSPVFFADKIETPLMIMSNDQDGAVPHTQGIELFTALRRLSKPTWMVVYNGEDHNIMERKNRKDFSVRLSQFFNHFLKGAPMPQWMADGVPAVDKGRTMGLELKPAP